MAQARFFQGTERAEWRSIRRAAVVGHHRDERILAAGVHDTAYQRILDGVELAVNLPGGGTDLGIFTGKGIIEDMIEPVDGMRVHGEHRPVIAGQFLFRHFRQEGAQAFRHFEPGVHIDDFSQIQVDAAATVHGAPSAVRHLGEGLR